MAAPMCCSARRRRSRSALVFIAIVARGGGGQFGAEYVAASAARFGRISRTRVRHCGNVDLADDDDVDGRGGTGFDHVSPRVVGRVERRVEFDDGDLLGVGELDRALAGARTFRSRARGCGSSRRSHGLRSA